MAGKELEQDKWQPPSCTDWLTEFTIAKLIVTLTGSFRFDGSMSALLARVGTISALRSIAILVNDGEKMGSIELNDALRAYRAGIRKRAAQIFLLPNW